MELILRYIELLELCRSELYDPFLADIEERCLEAIGILLRHNKNHDPVTGRFTFGKQYIDVTEEYKNRATPGEGSLTYDDSYNSKAHKEEIAFAQWLHNKMGGDIHLLNEQNQNHVKTSDYIWNSKLWDLKSLSSEKAANSALRKGINQISGNPGGVMLDCRKFNVEEKTLLGIIEKRMKWHRDIEVDIMIVKSESDIRVIRYKQI